MRPEGYPPGDCPEVAFAGRSNAGNSTLINNWLGHTLARVSGKPGKTDLLQFYGLGEIYRLVDMPGYGYAARSGKEVDRWKEWIETYFSCRANLRGVVLVMDIRRNWQEEEEQLLQWLARVERPLVVALSKADKLSRSQQIKRKKAIQSQSGCEHLFLVSSKKSQGLNELEDHIYNQWVSSPEAENEIPLDEKGE